MAATNDGLDDVALSTWHAGKQQKDKDEQRDNIEGAAAEIELVEKKQRRIKKEREEKHKKKED